MSSGMQRSLGGRNIALSPILMIYMILDSVITLSILCHLSLKQGSKGRAMYGYKCKVRVHGTAVDNSRIIWIFEPNQGLLPIQRAVYPDRAPRSKRQLPTVKWPRYVSSRQ